MRIYLNLANISVGKDPTGIGQYAMNLLQGIEEIGEMASFQLLVDRQSRQVIRDRFPRAVTWEVPDFPAKRLLVWKPDFFNLFYRDRVGVPWALKNKEKGILFHPFNALSVSNRVGMPTVVMVHDLFYKHFPQYHSGKLLWLLDRCYPGMLAGASRLVVPSHYVKEDLGRHFPWVPRDKVTVIHNPVTRSGGGEKRVDISGPFVLSVNAFRPHKNLGTLVKAFARIQDQVDHTLVLAGHGEDWDALHQLIRECGLKKVVLTGYVSEEEKNWLYRHADLFVSPSLHEGFGMTPVEAALHQVPVLTTRHTSLPEATRELLHYYEPAKDDQALARAMLQLLHHPPGGEQLAMIRDTYERVYNRREVAKAYCRFFHSVWEDCEAHRGEGTP